jgi:hypothetical protein
MTVLVAVRVPGKGAVIMSDSQGTAPDGRLYEVDKVVKFPGVVIAACGGLSTISALRRGKIKVYGDILPFVIEHGENHDFKLVCYDRVKDKLWTIDNNGAETTHSHWAAEGSGSAFSAGLLDDAPVAKTLKEAMSLARRAAAVACRLHVECGGPLRWVRSEVL